MLAIDIAEQIIDGNVSSFLLEENLSKIANDNSDSVNLKKIVMVLIQNLNLSQKTLDNLFKISIDENVKSSDVQNLFLANKISQDGDYFNSLSLIFNIIKNKKLLTIKFNPKLLDFNHFKKPRLE